MAKKKEKGLPYNNLEVVTEAKEHFIALCKQQEFIGNMISLLGKATKHPMISKSSIPQIHDRLAGQHYEITQEMTNLGTCFDLMPGKKVMKKEEKKEEKPKEETFVSNIAPKEETKTDE